MRKVHANQHHSSTTTNLITMHVSLPTTICI